MTAKDLKNALLQEAVQGKLVPQIASEGNARDLLNEIKNSHTDLQISTKSAGTGKKNSDLRSKSQIRVIKKEVAPITDEEVPFDIPESWCWCKLGELGDFTRGSGIKRDETTKTGLPCVRYGEMYTTYRTKFSITKSFTSEAVFNKCQKIHQNDILMALTGENKWDIALAAVYQGNEELALGGDLCKFTSKCYSLFLVYVINSPYGIEYKRNTSTGDIIVHTSTTKLGNMLIPLPPLAEQKRIVAAIEKFMPLIEEYGKKESALNLLNAQIASLTKKAILQEAVQGRLVPQIATEGNAKDLLAEIKKSHTDLQISTKSAGAKSDLRSKSQIRVTKKELPPITQEEIPFDIPESWCWVRINDIATCELGKTKDAQKNTGKLKDYLCSINIQEDGIDLSKIKQMKFEDDEFERYTVKKNDLLVCEGGDAGRCAIYDKEQPMHYQNALHRIRFFNDINPTFYLYIFQLYKANKILTEASKGVTIQHLTGASLKNLWFPLPPLAEQKRIVSAIEKLLPLCKKLGQ